MTCHTFQVGKVNDPCKRSSLSGGSMLMSQVLHLFKVKVTIAGCSSPIYD